MQNTEKNHTKKYKVGIDVGSTTAKIAILDNNNNLIHYEYVRHNTKIHETVNLLIKNSLTKIGNSKIKITITGSAGIGISEKTGMPFIQEVVASTEVVKKRYSQVKTLIDIGGEDSKMILFYEKKSPDIRMNGSCAGGTGAFIDQIASLMNIPIIEFNELAKNYSQIYPIASRCGVFAKTDVQNLLSRKIKKEDIAASVFHAVAIQTINTLARGFDIVPKVMFTGGPFAFLSELSTTFIRDLKLDISDIVIPENPALLPAIGAALSDNKFDYTSLQEQYNNIEKASNIVIKPKNRLKPLFKSKADFENWNNEKIRTKVPKVHIKDYKSQDCYIGIDSGSTTTKISVIGTNKELLYNYYTNSKGNPIDSVKKGLFEFSEILKKYNKKIDVKYTAVTGYGEDLIKTALGIDLGIVETIAHFMAAKHFNKDVSFIMDIGGQDMKAIFVENGVVNRIDLNEACSSGCGSFVETFSNSLGHKIGDFANLACQAQAPADLGTRCTVFMNSKVKQSLRENAKTEDIAAGLSISVIKNALFKVLKLRDITDLGDNIVVQGGTFRNPSILKALENLTEKKVICTDIPEQMGAYGAALAAIDEYSKNKLETKFVEIDKLDDIDKYKSKHLVCKACENRCAVTQFKFNNNNTYYSGNKCEKVFYNKGFKAEKGQNLYDYKYKLLFNRDVQKNENTKITIGIPRVLNFYENYPFWNKLLTESGFKIELSSTSTMKLYEIGLGTVMSDSICFPAKLVHGHISDLINKKVDRIFYPNVIFQANEFNEAENHFNCPIVSGYSDVVKSAINPQKKYNIPVDSPIISFKDVNMLKKACYNYLKSLGVKKSVFNKAFALSLDAQKKFKNDMNQKTKQVINSAKKNNELLIVLAGRPYHADPLINQKTPDILSDLGAHVIPDDSVPRFEENGLNDLQIITQWSYPNRIYNAAQWTASMPNNVQFVQFNSFGCGPDAITIDESVEILKAKGKNHTLIRIDEITSTGSVRLRLRSMLESLRIRGNSYKLKSNARITTRNFEKEDKQKTIIAPYFAEIYSDLFPSIFKVAGYKYINLPKPDKESVQYGLRYANNEICYPATIIIGDIIKALKSDNYNLNDIAVGISQTGGQCRASTYLSLIKKGMIASGFKDIPIVAVGTAGKTINPQPGFDIDWNDILPITFMAMLYGDSIAKMYYSMVVREKNKGESKKLLDKYINEVKYYIENKDIKGVYNLLEKAVIEFNRIVIYDKHYPKIGIVGEIFVKYNSFGNQYIVEWLIEQGVEVVVPPILDFFMQEFVNVGVNRKLNLAKNSTVTKLFLWYLEKKANRHINSAEKILKKFKFYNPHHKIRYLAKKAEEILSLSNQFGEGWLIPAEISMFAEEGVNNVISVQPFGCIANHVISKGIEKKIKDLFPNMNLLFLDFDDGASEVNILNRLHFMLKNVQEEVLKSSTYL